MHFTLYLAAFAVFLISAHQAKAVPPPDFIFSVGTQVVQFFTIATILLSAAGSMGYQFFKRHIIKRKRIVYWILLGFVVLSISGTGAWLYGHYTQKQAMNQWLAESKKYDQSTEVYSKGDINQEPTTSSTQIETSGDSLDQLTLGNGSSTQVISAQPDDEVTTFIQTYYNAIASHQFDIAYAMSKKSVSFETFKNWYTETQSVSIDKIQRIDSKRSSLELTLTEKHVKTRYGVLMDLRFDSSGKPIQIEQSTVRVLSEHNEAMDATDTSDANDYWNTFLEKSLSVSNEDFQSIINIKSPMLVLDARENIEFENGHFPNATHIRFADLKAGRWIELPTDKPVYVFCWSGIRGKEVTEFLRSKKIAAQYLINGADGWVTSKGAWEGDISFLKVYTDDHYKRVFTLDEVKKQINDGVTLVDTRSPNAFSSWHIPGSISIPLMSTPTISIEQALAQVPKSSRIITVCDGYVNCFDAKLVGVELERRGHTFLGRFAEPWKLKE
jgi:rhodanese-related sulfurtransferase